MSTLACNNVAYAYEKGNGILTNISFCFESGKMYAILGPSGSGKTTLLSLLGGLDTPTKGNILFDDTDIMQTGLEDHRRKHVSLIFQNYNLIDYMTPIENTMLASKVDAIPILRRLGLKENELRRTVLKLSGGQQQRVAIARALAMNPKIMLFDEPTSALDPELVGEVLNTIRQLAQEKRTMVIVTHEMSFARDVADRAIFMDQGRIVEQGAAKALFADPQQPRTRQFLEKFLLQ